MHNLTPAVIAAACLGIVAAPIDAQTEGPSSLPPEGTPMVFVNTGVILPVAPGADSAQASYQRVLEGYDQELQQLAAEIDSMVNDYRRQEAMLDQAGRDAKQQEILARQQAAQTRQIELNQMSERRRQELLQPIREQILQVIEDVRAERGYIVVLDIAESGVVAAEPNLDITEVILQRMGIDPASLQASN